MQSCKSVINITEATWTSGKNIKTIQLYMVQDRIGQVFKIGSVLLFPNFWHLSPLPIFLFQ